jgi:DNA polymerase-3 subunit chi
VSTVEFIELPEPDRRLHEVCRFAEKHYDAGRPVCIYLPDPSEAAQLDKALWTFRQGAFIPHVRVAEADEPMIEPVLIVGRGDTHPRTEVLILAHLGETPQWAADYDYVQDFAPLYDDELRDAARARFAAWQKAGHQMRFVKAS